MASVSGGLSLSDIMMSGKPLRWGSRNGETRRNTASPSDGTMPGPVGLLVPIPHRQR